MVENDEATTTEILDKIPQLSYKNKEPKSDNINNELINARIDNLNLLLQSQQQQITYLRKDMEHLMAIVDSLTTKLKQTNYFE